MLFRQLGVRVTPRRGDIVGRVIGGVDWIIVGGESGDHARPFHLDWARDVIRAAKEAGRPVFMKQLGENAHGFGNEQFTGADCPDELRPKGKGDDPNEWPRELRVQEFPT